MTFKDLGKPGFKALNQTFVCPDFLLLLRLYFFLDRRDFVVGLQRAKTASQAILSQLEKSDSEGRLVQVVNILSFSKSHQK